MKSQRRHDLETNSLAKRLSAWGERIEPYSKAITVTTIAVGVVVLVVVFISSRRAASRRAAWDEFTYALTSTSADLDALRQAAEEHPNTPMSRLANVTWADNELRLATELFFRDQAAAESHLEKARKVYRELIDKAQDPAILNRARLGMARALETEGKPKEAAEFYAAVQGPFAHFAQERVQELRKESVQDAITWLASAEMPEIQAPTGPGTPGARPPFSGFQLDPTIPASGPFSGAAGTSGGGVPGSLAPAGAQSGDTPPLTSQEPLDFINPFARPSDPNRYATPPADDVPEATDSTVGATPEAGGPAIDTPSNAPAEAQPEAGSTPEDAAGAEDADGEAPQDSAEE